jgi:hypothetical protein
LEKTKNKSVENKRHTKRSPTLHLPLTNGGFNPPSPPVSIG